MAEKLSELVTLDVEIGAFLREFSLSAREGEVFCLLLSGITTAENIAKSLSISPHTVNNHLKSMFQKTAAPNKTEIVALFVRRLIAKLNHCKMFAKQPKVMLVDDDKDITDLMSDYLIQRGIKVLAFNDAREALAAVTERPVDFVITDIAMPTFTGLQLLAEIRRIQHVQPRVILISGVAPQSVEESLAAGAVAFIKKPLSFNKLFFTIMEHFIEGTHELSRLLRVATQVPSIVNSSYKFTLTNIGFGGAFFALR